MDFRVAVGLLCSATFACVSQAPVVARRPPNIVLIVADDLGWGELGCYGQQKIRTPRIDALAREGMRFTQFYSGAPVCAPSRCALLTGLHAGHMAVRDNVEIQPEGQMALPDASVTLAELLRERGYATGCFGKWGLGAPGSEGAPNAQGFEQFFGYLCQRQAHDYYPDHLWRNGQRVELDGAQYSHDRIAEEALAFVREHARQPFLLYVPFTIPHLALQVPEDSLAEYRGMWEDPPYDGRKGYRAHPTPRAAYAAMVTRMDRDVGRIVDLLGELGLGDDTLVLFTSDNGPTYDRLGGSDSSFFDSAAGLRGLKGSVYEGGLRVPLVARWPGCIAAGVESAHVAAFWDVLPTLLELAGGATPTGVDGLSFAPTLLARGAQTQHEALYWELGSYGGQQALRAGDWKAVRRDLAKGVDALQLYDLARDPGEAHDVASEHPELVESMRARLSAVRVEHPAFPLFRAK
ncbi:MAG: arylsulfatase [Planctomycetes bacterium]|nr:arylsulfatase [Planctomycetota bacterium]